MKPFNIFKFSLLLASPLVLLGCAGDQYAQQSSTDDLYFSRSDRKVTQPYQEDLSSSSSIGYSEDYLRNRETDLDYGDEEYTARDVNPEYIAKYKKQGQENLNREGENPQEDVYFEEDYNEDRTYSNYTGGNAYSQPNYNYNRNNGAWQNNPYTFGPNRWNSPWNRGFNNGWSFGMHSGWSNWGNSFGWNIGYNWGNPWGYNDPFMNPYNSWGWNDPFMNPYYASRFGYGWGYPAFYRPYYPVRQVVVVRPAEPGVNRNVQVVNGYRGSRSNTIGVSNQETRTNRRMTQEPASADNPNEDRIVTPDRYRYSRERTEESPRSRSRSQEMNRSNTNRSNRSVSPNRNSNSNQTYQRSNRSNRSSGGGSGTYQRSRRSNSSSGGGGGSTMSTPKRNSSSGSSYTPSRSRSSSGSSSGGGGSRSRSRRGGSGGGE
ncbi:MAG: hypothetical protein WBH03_23215 [Cyclobacteriaceae bacterium]